MTTISVLPEDLVEEEIFSRVFMSSLRSVRSTCKKWNSLSKNRILFIKAEAAAARKQLTGFVMMDSKICLMKYDLQGIRNNGDLVDPCIIKQVSKLDQVEISNVLHSEGLLLCVVEDKSRLSSLLVWDPYLSLLVWNPYLGQTKWIQVQPKIKFLAGDMYALGYDKNRNHKILRIFSEYSSNTGSFVYVFQIYDFSSDSWKVIDVTPDWKIEPQRGVSLKGNAYFSAKKMTRGVNRKLKVEYFLLCFDFTTQSFGPRLPLPFDAYDERVDVYLSCVREEQLAVLYQRRDRSKLIEICVTDKIDPNVVSWKKFLKLLNGFQIGPFAGSFFIDEEKKIAVAFDIESSKACQYHTAHIMGQDGYFKSVNIREALNLGPTMIFGSQIPKSYCIPLVCSSYVPSLVKLQINQATGHMERM